MQAAIATLKRHEVRRIILSRYGEIARLAVALKVSRTLVTQVLKGKATSRNVYDACYSRALQILAEKSTRTPDGAAISIR
jgi:hypothetical protein